jgi:PAS domain S-box-containing protein
MKDQDKAKEQVINELVELRQRITELEASEAERRRTEEEIRQRNRELAALNAIATVVSQSLNLDEILNAALDKVLELMRLDVGGIYLFYPERHKLNLVVHRGISKEFAREVESVSVDEKTLEAVTAEGKLRRFVLSVEAVVKDRAELKRILSAMKEEGLSLAFGTPVLLQAREEVLGLMIVASRVPRRFSGAELRLLTSIGQQIAIAIQNARLFEEEKRGIAQLALINEVGEKAASILDLDRLMPEVTRSIQERFNYYNVALFLLDEERREVVMQAVAGGFEHMTPGEYRQSIDEGIIGFVARTGKSWLASDVSQDRYYVKGFLEEVLTKSELCIPVKLGDKVIGALDVQSTHVNDFDQSDVTAMEAVADQLAIAIENARLYERAQQEITEHKQAEEALRESEEQLRQVIQNMPVMLDALDADNNIIVWNRECERVTGYSAEEIVGNPKALELLYPDTAYLQRMLAEWSRRGDNFRDWELELTNKDGSVKTVAWSNISRRFPVPGWATWSIGIDITGRKRAEEQILSLATKLKAVARPARQMSALLDLDELTQQVAQSLQEVTGCYNANLFLLEDDGLVLAAGRGGYEDGKPPLGYRLSLGQGIIGHVAQTGQPVLVPDVSQDPRYVAWEGLPHTRSELAVPVKRGDEVLGVVDMQAMEPNAFDVVDLEALGVLADQLAVALDNTRLYEETRQLAAFNESIVQNMAEGIVMEDAEGCFTFVNPAAAAMLGYAPEELLGQHWTVVTPPDQHSIVRAIDGRRMRGEADRYELELVRKDGARIYVLVSGSPRFEEGRFAGTLAVFTDITRRKRAERLLQALNQAALAMERALTTKEIFTAVAGEFKKLGFSCIVFLTDESQSRLLIRYVSYETRAVKALEKLTGLKIENFSIPTETTDVYRKVVRERKAAFIENVEDVIRQFLPKPLKKFTGRITRMLKIARSITAPLIVEDEVIGLLSVESDDLTEDDVPAISAFAHQMAAAWRKATLLQDLERSLAEVRQSQEELQRTTETLRKTLGATIQAMAVTVETRDAYTAGHQRQVANLARAIATEMGLSKGQIEGIRMAAVIHDIGKISVPAEILSKPGRLNDLEWGMIKTHPRVGYDILKTVEFPWPVAQIVLQHHERLDGSGYPQGLSGEEILLEARILAVADVVEAMASHRPYRAAHGIDEALEEISQNRGILYDPEVVDACLKLFSEKKLGFGQEINVTI